MNWIKRRLTSLTFWAGLVMIVGALLFPRWMFLSLGVVLMFLGDETVKAFFAKHEEAISKKLDEVSAKT